MTSSEQFLRDLLTDSTMQQSITSIRFETIQSVATQYGYEVSATDIDTALASSPDLVAQLQDLITASDLEFELDEAEMALIAGGGQIPQSTFQCGIFSGCYEVKDKY